MCCAIADADKVNARGESHSAIFGIKRKNGSKSYMEPFIFMKISQISYLLVLENACPHELLLLDY